jgi:hypothetical protein
MEAPNKCYISRTMVAQNMRKLKANSFKQQIKPHMSRVGYKKQRTKANDWL